MTGGLYEEDFDDRPGLVELSSPLLLDIINVVKMSKETLRQERQQP
jgi:hypothetical protein